MKSWVSSARWVVGGYAALLLVACGSDSDPQRGIVGSWTPLDPTVAVDTGKPIQKVTYVSDGTMTFVEAGRGPDSGEWELKKDLLGMWLACGAFDSDCPFIGLKVNVEVTDTRLAWIYADGTRWEFSRIAQ